ncbi:MAG: hypothetical protein LBJ58_00105 [Tannerellaceae bacterium]|jgi:hypothetical protein|nr:hypothetical protein [Tannerellaceae bacterium]
MKKIITVFTLSFLLSSCFEEKADPEFMNETVWSSYTSGTAVSDGGIKYSYMETHTLTFSKKTYVHTLDRQETEGDGKTYYPVGEETIEGTYAVSYPEIIMTEKNQESLGTVSLEGMLIVDRGNELPLVYHKMKNK